MKIVKIIVFLGKTLKRCRHLCSVVRTKCRSRKHCCRRRVKNSVTVFYWVGRSPWVAIWAPFLSVWASYTSIGASFLFGDFFSWVSLFSILATFSFILSSSLSVWSVYFQFDIFFSVQFGFTFSSNLSFFLLVGCVSFPFDIFFQFLLLFLLLIFYSILSR